MSEIIHTATGTLIAICAFSSIIWAIDKLNKIQDAKKIKEARKAKGMK